MLAVSKLADGWMEEWSSYFYFLWAVSPFLKAGSSGVVRDQVYYNICIRYYPLTFCIYMLCNATSVLDSAIEPQNAKT